MTMTTMLDDVLEAVGGNRVWEMNRDHYVPLAFCLVLCWPVVLSLLMTVTAASTWILWVLASAAFTFAQIIYAMYQFIMILGDVLCLSTLKTYSTVRSQILYYVLGRKGRKSRRRIWRELVDRAGSYQNFQKIPVEPKEKDENKLMMQSEQPIRKAQSYSKLENMVRRHGSTLSRVSSFHRQAESHHHLDYSDKDDNEEKGFLEKELGMTGQMLITTTTRLREARQQASIEGTEEAASSLKYLLSGVVKRNHLTLDDILLENARSVAQLGRYGLTEDAQDAIHEYYQEVEKCLNWIAESPLAPRGKSPQFLGVGIDTNIPAMQTEMRDRITLIRKMKQNMGRTALMLSGGGAQAMYHLGTIRALIDSKLYNDIKVISGTSGGSITAAMCAIKTPEELWEHVCVKKVSTDYMLTGRMKKENIRWFPPSMEMAAYWFKHKLLVDSADFKRCCDFYYGDMTFEEAFERTGKHVCITVSASRATGNTVQRLLLNHISTPHVTISSAVAASCALPGVMAPTKLLTKDSTGKQEPFEVDGVEWIDGSVQADLPFQRISTLFNVSNYVVGQTNFHVVPLLNKAHHPSQRSYYWRLFQTFEWDIRNRALKLSRLGLFPRIFGQDISKVFTQKYDGNLTLVPRFTVRQTFGLKALANPTVEDMTGYLKYGQVAAWPYLGIMRDMVRLEVALDHCLQRLQERRRILNPEMSDWADDDDLDSIASSSVPTISILQRATRFSAGGESERLKQKVMSLEQENFALQQRLNEMQTRLEAVEGARKPQEKKNGIHQEENRVPIIGGRRH